MYLSNPAEEPWWSPSSNFLWFWSVGLWDTGQFGKQELRETGKYRSNCSSAGFEPFRSTQKRVVLVFGEKTAQKPF